MSKALALTALPSGSMDAYISAAFQLPMLSAEEERSLAIRLRDHQDLEAAQQLILSHIRFVVRIALLPAPDDHQRVHAVAHKLCRLVQHFGADPLTAKFGQAEIKAEKCEMV